MSVAKHLANAKKFFGQGRYADAIYEYRCVLDLDPTNADALAAMRSLTDMPEPDEAGSQSQAGSGGKIKTNFLSHQAQEASTPITKQSPVIIVGLIVGIGIIYGLYQLVTYYMNYDKIVALKYVNLHLLKPAQKDGATYVTVQMENFNPQDVKDFTFKYQINGADGSVLSSGNVMVAGLVPAGDQRTFANIKLGPFTGNTMHLNFDPVDLHLGPKPSMTPQMANKFIEAAAMRPEDALVQLTEFVKAQPEFGPGYIRLGQALLANKDDEHAIKAFEKAIKLDPDDANAHYHLGVAYFYKSDAEGACREFEQALKLAPDDQVIAGALKQVEGNGGMSGKKDADKSGEAAKNGTKSASSDKSGE